MTRRTEIALKCHRTILCTVLTSILVVLGAELSYAQSRSTGLEYTIVFDEPFPPVAHYVDHGVIAKTEIEYWPDTDRVRNLSEVDAGSGVYALFQNPLHDAKFEFISELDRDRHSPDASVLLLPFGITLSEDDERRANGLPPFGFFRVDHGNVSITVAKMPLNRFRVAVLEIRNESGPYEATLHLGSSRSDVAERLGTPNFATTDGSIYIYPAFPSLRQLNIYWINNQIDRIELVAFGGV